MLGDSNREELKETEPVSEKTGSSDGLSMTLNEKEMELVSEELMKRLFVDERREVGSIAD